MAYELTYEQRERYRETSTRSSARKQRMLSGFCEQNIIKREKSSFRLNVNELMPQLEPNNLTSLSLFAGGGGLDLGFERAGFDHTASYEILDICGETLKLNRPRYNIKAGNPQGDVREAAFSTFRGVDVVHGGPPCQPFSIAGKQAGEADARNMWPEFIRCVTQSKPRAFIAENVPGLLDKKFESFVSDNILAPLSETYTVFKFKLHANGFGVPQARSRVFFVGFRAARDAARWLHPLPTHGNNNHSLLTENTTRFSLGLPDIGYDTVAPTLRSGFTGPRNTTGILNSKAALKVWGALNIWPNGVQISRAKADAYTAENGHYRLCVDDCALLQGFPDEWQFRGAVYQVLGQIGNSVCPPVAYSVAKQVALALGGNNASSR